MGLTDLKNPQTAVRLAAAVTWVAGIIELGGAWRGHSLFLVADAVHLMAHMGVYAALLIPKTFWRNGNDKTGTSLVLGVVLAIALGVVVASIRDLVAGHTLAEPAMMLLSLLGLSANLLTAWMFRGLARSRLSFRVALVHELSDAAMTFVGWRALASSRSPAGVGWTLRFR